MRRQMWMPEIGVWGRGKIAAHFAMAAHVEGEVTTDQFQDAVQRLARRHPLLTARVVAEPDYTYWFDIGESAPIETRIVPRDDESTWLTAAAEAVGLLFDSERGPLGRGTVEDIAYSPDSETLTVAGLIGLWLYDAHNLTPKQYIQSHATLEDTVVGQAGVPPVLANTVEGEWTEVSAEG